MTALHTLPQAPNYPLPLLPPSPPTSNHQCRQLILPAVPPSSTQGVDGLDPGTWTPLEAGWIGPSFLSRLGFLLAFPAFFW